jgi:PEGA domain
MGSPSIPFLAALLVALPLTTSSAQERRAPAGAVIVRPVQVREVRVDQPKSSHRHEERPTFGLERPVDPGLISRPFARPQPKVDAPWHSKRHVKLRTGFGVIGYPVIYPYAYPYGDPFSPYPAAPYAPAAPVPNTYSNVAASSSAETITAAPPVSGAIECDGAAACGGVSFDISPASAQVWVDGVFVGDADEFDATSTPLLLSPGDHYIEVRLAGYRTASLDVTIVAGEIAPYQGMLERLRLRRP